MLRLKTQGVHNESGFLGQRGQVSVLQDVGLWHLADQIRCALKGRLLTPQQTLLRDAREYYRSGFDFHSTASFCASAICAGVICCATRFRLLIASWSLRAAAKLSHMYA